jgi:L-ribulose-5-phosphate 3-epimerase
MKKGINQWSLPIGDDFEAVLRHCGASGIPNVELCILPAEDGLFPKVTVEPELEQLFRNVERTVNAANYRVRLTDTPDQLRGLKQSVERAGVKVVSVTTLDLFRYTLTSADPAVREASVWVINKMVDICAALGGQTVLVEPGVVTASLGYREAYANCQAALREAVRYAEQKGVVLGLENVWGRFLVSPLELCEMIDSMKSEAAGAYFDVANILAYGLPQDWIHQLGKRLKSVHFKDFRFSVGGLQGFCNPYDGEVDWIAVRDALRRTGYAGPVVAEVILPRVWQEGFIEELSRKMDWLVGES